MIVLAPIFLLSASLEYTLEARIAGFYSSSNTFRKIYGNWNPSYEIEARAGLDCSPIEGWVNIDYTYASGSAIGFHARTKIYMTNYSLGLRYNYSLCDQYLLYIGAGPNFASVRLKNNSVIDKERINKNAVGGVFKMGVNYFVTDTLFLDAFVDYLVQPIKFEHRKEVGGFKTGIGLGLKF